MKKRDSLNEKKNKRKRIARSYPVKAASAENIKKEEINLDEIIIATPKKEDEEPVILRGRVEFFNEARGFGFIKDLAGVDKYFFHVNNVVGNISEGNIVTFDLERGVKGMNAVNICLEKKPVEN